MKLRRNASIILVMVFIFSPLFSDTIHIVQKSETLYSLGRKYEVSVSEIQNANNMGTSTTLKIGQKLIIPGKELETPVKTATPVYKMYTVVKGDTLYSIAKNNNLTVDELRKINNLSETAILKIGQTLKVGENSSTNIATTKPTTTTNPTTNPIAINKDNPREVSNKKGDTSLIWPVKAKQVEYVTGKISGVSLKGSKNENVTAIRSGTVTYSGMYRGFGQVIFVQDSSGYMYVYTGLSAISVTNGEKVSYGQSIGTIGHDSFSNEDTMDFMVYKDSKPIDPADAPRG